MEHKFYINRLSAYADGELDQALSEKIRAHLEDCAECKEAYSNIVRMQEAIGTIKEIEKTEEFDHNFKTALLEEKEKNQKATIVEKKLDSIIINLGKLTWSQSPIKIASTLVAATLMLAVGLNMFISRPKDFACTVIASRGLAQVYNNADKKWMTVSPGMSINSKDIIKLAGLAQVDISSKNLFKVRLKQNSEVEFIDLAKNLNSKTDIKVKRGKILVRTSPKFKGSMLNIITPSSKTEVLGTALMVDVAPRTNTTWVGVLKGVVAVKGLGIAKDKAHLNRVLVKEGHKTSVKPGQVPSLPEIFSDKEWQMMDEMYRVGDLPQVSLLIGATSNRVEKLLAPCMLFIYDEHPRKIPEEIEDIMNDIRIAVEKNDIELHRKAADRLHKFIIRYPNKLYDVQFLMFLGGYNYFIKDYDKSIELFNNAIDGYPDSKLQSLAICAKAYIYEKALKDPKKAKRLYQDILDFYPTTPDALYAKEALARLK